METNIVTASFISLYAFTPCTFKKYAYFQISTLQSALISMSGICTFIAAGILMGEPVPPFPEWGVFIPYWVISLVGFILFMGTICLAIKWQPTLKYSWMLLGYPVLFVTSVYLANVIYTASI